MTLATIEPAYHLYCDIANSVANFVVALESLQLGELQDAHWWLWRAGMTRSVPPLDAPIRRKKTAPKQPSLFQEAPAC